MPNCANSVISSHCEGTENCPTTSCELLEILLKTEWKSRMVEAEYAFHVTNVIATDPQPQFNELRFNLADDLNYDRQLVGFPCVFFTTTKYHGCIPDRSPYPTLGQRNANYWRVKIPLNQFKNYDIWYCKYPVRHPKKHGGFMYQVRLILTNNECEKQFVKNFSVKKLQNNEENPFLYCKVNGQWMTNEYSGSHKKYKINYFVNFVVLKDFPLIDVQWDTVKKMNVGVGKPMSRNDLATYLIRDLPMYWKSLCDCEEVDSEETLYSDSHQALIPSKIAGQIFDFYKAMIDPKYFDVIFVAVDGTEIPSHRGILSKNSRKFLSMFESANVLPIKIDAKEFDCETIKDALNACYGISECNLATKNAKKIFEFATKFEISFLQEACSSYFEETVSPINACEYIKIAYSNNLEILKLKCQKEQKSIESL